MAKKVTPNKAAPTTPAKAVTPPTDAAPRAAAIETSARKTVMPKSSPAGAAVEVTKAASPLSYERIAERAYHISQSGTGGSEYDNWLRAERELKNEA